MVSPLASRILCSGMIGILTLGVIVLAPPDSPVLAAPASVPFVTIASGSTSRISEPMQVVIRDADTWAALWRRHEGSQAGPPPGVDFTQEMVIALFGPTGNGPMLAQIGRIDARPNRLTVWYVLRETRPLPESSGPSSIPFHIVRLPRSPLSVQFVQVKSMPVVSRP